MKTDPEFLKSVLEETKVRATYGYLRVTSLINRKRRKEGLPRWNEKRILRFMRINGLMLEKHPLKQMRPHLGKVMTMRSNVRWCTHIFEIRCWNAEKVFVAFSLDCHDREIMGFVAQKRALFHQVAQLRKAFTSRLKGLPIEESQASSVKI